MDLVNLNAKDHKFISKFQSQVELQLKTLMKSVV